MGLGVVGEGAGAAGAEVPGARAWGAEVVLGGVGLAEGEGRLLSVRKKPTFIVYSLADHFKPGSTPGRMA